MRLISVPLLLAFGLFGCAAAGGARPQPAQSVGSTSVTDSQTPISWADSIDAVEVESIRATNGRVSRLGIELRIQLLNGRTITLEDDTVAGSTYSLPRYAGHLPKIRSHVVHVLPYEGSGNYRVIDDSTGHSTVVWGMPVPSADGTRFALTSMVGEDGADPGLIEVWKMVNRDPQNEFSFGTENEAWQPSDAVWRDSNTIEFFKNSRADPSDPYVKTLGRLVRTGIKWVLVSP